MLKKLALGLAFLVVTTMFSGCTMMKMGSAYMGFPDKTQEAYADMMAKLDETGDPAQAMMLEWEVAFCSLSIAKKMLDHSRYYGGFMPCRVIYVEYGDGRRYLVSMDMTLAIYGGTDKKPIPEELFESMLEVKKAMEEIPAMAASGD